MEKLSATLKQLLNNANISEAELARRTGIAQPMVNRLATGKNKNPKLETLKPIAKYFSITFSQLLGEENLPSNFMQSGDQFNNINSDIHQLPLFSFDKFEANNSISERIIATTIKISNKAFALLVSNEDLSPRFPKNTILTIEPEIDFNANDFILVHELDTNTVNLTQVKFDTENNKLLKNISANQSSEPYSLNPNNHKVLGTLIQTTYDYKLI